MRRNQVRKWIFGLIAIGMIAACTPTGAQQDHDLMQDAKRLVDTSKWVNQSYLWCDSHTLIAFTGHPTDNIVSPGPVPIVNETVQVDTDTGQVQPLTALTQRWKQELQRHFHQSFDQGWEPGGHSLSPDGKWLAIAAQDPFWSPTAYWTVFSLDGSECLPIGEESSMGLDWSPDSRQCFFFDVGGAVDVFDMPIVVGFVKTRIGLFLS